MSDAPRRRDGDRHDRCGGVTFEVHLTPGAIDALRIEAGKAREIETRQEAEMRSAVLTTEV